ncbi:PorT family protein [Flavobacterium sp. H122]|uniref:PorT family protein n=1 Tax=Flavobacterium sp. H122 TaxID=2529860 RepID=UPI0010AAEAD9|nr:PorT family protein [Flavobacterium sp. H122]
MENKKEIGKFFRQKLEQLDKVPNDSLWNTIEKDLNIKPKKRIPLLFWLIPLSITTIGLVTFFSISYSSAKNNFFNNNREKNVSTEANSNNKIHSLKQNNSLTKSDSQYLNSDKISSSELTGENNKEKEIKTEFSVSSQKTKQQPETGSEKNMLYKKNISSSEPTSNSSQKQQNPKNTKTYYTKEPTKLIINTKRLVKSTPEYDEYEIVKKYTYVIKKKKVTIPSKSKKTTDKNSSIKNKVKSGNKIKNKKTNNIESIKPEKKQKNIRSKNSKAENKKIEKENTDKKTTDTLSAFLKNKPIAFEKTTVAKNESQEIKPDSADIDSIQEKLVKKIKKPLPKKQYHKLEKDNKPDYYAAVFYGPAIYGYTSKKTMPNSDFDSLGKGHPVSSYYGFSLRTEYKKIGYKVGVSKINLKISSHLNNPEIIPNYNNIELNQNVTSTTIQEDYENDTEIELIQKISYYEIPFEVTYSIFKNKDKFNSNIFTGFSLMINDDNSLSLKSREKNEKKIGTLKNLSHSNISYNIGIGLSYKIHKQFYFECNPVFKYYLSTLKENKGVKPYSLSLQTGIAYKF